VPQKNNKKTKKKHKKAGTFSSEEMDWILANTFSSTSPVSTKSFFDLNCVVFKFYQT